MLHRTFSAALFAGTIAASLPAAAHFGLILPDPAMVLEQSKTAFKLDVSFIRPMEASTMTMVKPGGLLCGRRRPQNRFDAGAASGKAFRPG